MTRTWTSALLLAATLCGAATAASAQAPTAQNFPDKSIKIVVPWAAGGPTDVFARLIGHHLQGTWKQPVVIENRPGGTGSVGAAAVAQADPDGHTLLFNSVTQVIAPLLQAKPAYNPATDFEPVAMAVRNPLVVLTGSASSFKTLGELIGAAKQKPGALNYASAGPGSVAHLVTELFKNRAGVDLVHVPYKGGAPAVNALLTGEVQLFFSDLGSARSLIEAGKVRALAQVGAQRSPHLADVPTLKEAGVEHVEISFWNGLFAPKNTPAAIVAKLNAEVNRGMTSDAVADKVKSFGSEALTGTPEDFRATLTSDIAVYGEVIKRANLTVD